MQNLHKNRRDIAKNTVAKATKYQSLRPNDNPISKPEPNPKPANLIIDIAAA